MEGFRGSRPDQRLWITLFFSFLLPWWPLPWWPSEAPAEEAAADEEEVVDGPTHRSSTRCTYFLDTSNPQSEKEP